MKDTLFLDPGRRKSSFAFDEAVAAVFDDMLKRSIPFYFEIQNMIADLLDEFVPANGKVCDLGCSTGTTIGLLSKRLATKNITFEGFDNSAPMLQRAEENLLQLGVNNFKLIEQDLNDGVTIEQTDAVIMNLVLQFVRPANRERLLKDAYSGLKKSGCLILVEKIAASDERLNHVFTEKYLEFKKRNLYTDQEIAAKRKALENILIPNRTQDNILLMKEAGFRSVEVFFNWFNFCGVVGLKG
ncbi:MAG: carboxy-S-adenosyl-L-methionine synthase CmoA [Gammaproteobacteria bacterium]|nr:carboxy-S-adenosyl-L-methionine synthase CmoA [Gammaproteobacteria bacterium]